MRQFTGGDGSNTTATVDAYLRTTNQIILADLYQVGEQDDPTTFQFTDWEAPLLYPPNGLFLSSVVSRGKISSQVGLKVDTLDISWSPKLTAFGTNASTFNPYQKAQFGFFDSMRVKVWRTLMPTPGDAYTFGTTPWFGGRVADSVVQRGLIKFTISSFLDAINQKTPPNVIEASNAIAGYTGAAPVTLDSETQVPIFQVVAPSNTNIILGDAQSPHLHKIYANGRFQFGYIQFLPGSSLAGYFSPVANNISFAAGGGVHYNEFQTYAPFPTAPIPGDQFYASTQIPMDFATALAGQFKGFPFVPAPLTAI